MTKTHLLLTATLVLVAGCKKDGEATAAPDTKAAPAATGNAGNARAEVDKASAVALPMCTKEFGTSTFEDFKTSDALVARYPNPLPKPGEDKDTPFAWVGKKAGVVRSDDDGFDIIVVPDDTDPCAIKYNAELTTSKKNPVAHVEIMANKPGNYQSWYPGPTSPTAQVEFGSSRNDKYERASFSGMVFAKVTKLEMGKSVELDLHGCYEQNGNLMGGQQQFFAVGHLTAAWCPKP